MTRLLLSILLAGLLNICSSQETPVSSPAAIFVQFRTTEQNYQQAEENYLHNQRIPFLDTFQYTQVLSSFEQLVIPVKKMRDDSLNRLLHLRIASIRCRLGEPAKAIEQLRKVSTTSNRSQFDLYYNYAVAYGALNNPDSLRLYTDLAIQDNARWNGKNRNYSYGLFLKFRAEQYVADGRYYDAIQQYHQAIMQFEPSFDTADIYQNPLRFSDSASFVQLFYTITAKANAFEHILKNQKNIKAMNWAIDTYKSALLLIEYVRKEHNPAKARSLFKNSKEISGNAPLRISIELYELTRKSSYMEDAYYFDQQYKILQPLLNTDPRDKQSAKETQVPSVASLQQLIDNKTALLSYTVTDNALITFVITRKEFSYHAETVLPGFYTDVDSFSAALNDPDITFNAALASKLYQLLISPVETKLAGIKRLIILPGNRLQHVPFVALQTDKKYLLEKYAVQYQGSAALIGDQTTKPDNKSLAGLLDTSSLLRKGIMCISPGPADSSCSNRITSKWRGDEKVTSLIVKQFIYYLSEGYSKDQAFQKARLDLLKNPDVESRLKEPFYWAGFYYIGEYEPPYTPIPWLKISIIASLVVALIWVITIKSNY